MYAYSCVLFIASSKADTPAGLQIHDTAEGVDYYCYEQHFKNI